MMNNDDDTPPTLVPRCSEVDFGLVDAEMRGVMRNRVNPTVSVKYGTANPKFIFWLFDNQEHYGALRAPEAGPPR